MSTEIRCNTENGHCFEYRHSGDMECDCGLMVGTHTGKQMEFRLKSDPAPVSRYSLMTMKAVEECERDYLLDKMLAEGASVYAMNFPSSEPDQYYVGDMD